VGISFKETHIYSLVFQGSYSSSDPLAPTFLLLSRTLFY